jgi:hypothetical protein
LTRLQEVLLSAVQAVGINVGAAHIEACTTANGPVLFELGARCGGGATADPIVPYVSGYPYFENVIRLLTGDLIEPPEAFSSGQRDCIYGFFTVENREMDRLVKTQDFIDWEVFSRENLPDRTRQGGDRLGYYIYQGNVSDLPLKEELSCP